MLLSYDSNSGIATIKEKASGRSTAIHVDRLSKIDQNYLAVSAFLQQQGIPLKVQE